MSSEELKDDDDEDVEDEDDATPVIAEWQETHSNDNDRTIRSKQTKLGSFAVNSEK